MAIKGDQDASGTRFGQHLMDAMAASGLSIRDVAAKAGTTYEYIRKLVRGLGLPSQHMLRILCDELKMNRKDAEKLLVADRIESDYGKIPSELAGKNPDAELFDRHISELEPEQREALEAQLRMYLTQNRRRKKR